MDCKMVVGQRKVDFIMKGKCPLKVNYHLKPLINLFVYQRSIVPSNLYPGFTNAITERAKLLNADPSIKRGFFLNFACEAGKSYSLTIGPQVASQHLMLKRSCFSVTMKSRLEMVDEEYIEEFMDKSKNENMKNSTEYWKNVLEKWANQRNFQANLQEYESDVLDQTLS